ncbi:hypothetical protein P8V03_00325 [Clostridium sp. A1-XYC3]|uniref:Uncharacterized protein n=1 Tax=Clostridium tanneri TaxID=3037988 RepID=A0ABU4JN69_9CLOT|nr:hypothetical protein [Clostridium sp. A1-XYC3]MDW8799594.1 hypothetical protein [Clostridium sp. A1-XYC3]
MYKKYRLLLFLCIIFNIVMIIGNYKVHQQLLKYEGKERIIEQQNDQHLVSKKYGYSDIVQGLGQYSNIKIKSFNEPKDNTVSVEIELLGNIYDEEKTLKELKNLEYFHSIEDIRIEKHDNEVSTVVNVTFIKNR